jgi:hypothetical protein
LRSCRSECVLPGAAVSRYSPCLSDALLGNIRDQSCREGETRSQEKDPLTGNDSQKAGACFCVPARPNPMAEKTPTLHIAVPTAQGGEGRGKPWSRLCVLMRYRDLVCLALRLAVSRCCRWWRRSVTVFWTARTRRSAVTHSDAWLQRHIGPNQPCHAVGDIGPRVQQNILPSFRVLTKRGQSDERVEKGIVVGS